MAIIEYIVIFGLILSFYFGQLFRLNLFGIDFPGINIFIIAFAVLNIIRHYQQKKLHPQNIFFIFFIIFSFLSLIINSLIFHLPLLKPFFYLLRLSCLLSLFIFPPVIAPKLKKFFFISLIANIIFGLVQYFFWPDFTYFKAFNWDPHLYRLVSTYFDPTFTGLIYLFFIIYLFFNFSKLPRLFSGFLFLLSYLALALTYSRSTLLSLATVALFCDYQKHSLKTFPVVLLVIITTITLLPRYPGESTKLERTSSITAKIINYQQGFQLFSTSPIIGHGYNQLANLRPDVSSSSHAISGLDSSLLTILATTGIIGFLLFFLGLVKLFIVSSPTIRFCLIAILVHSLFANSLLYPWTLLFLILI